MPHTGNAAVCTGCVLVVFPQLCSWDLPPHLVIVTSSYTITLSAKEDAVCACAVVDQAGHFLPAPQSQ